VRLTDERGYAVDIVQAHVSSKGKLECILCGQFRASQLSIRDGSFDRQRAIVLDRRVKIAAREHVLGMQHRKQFIATEPEPCLFDNTD
jgi:hypothetical protein